MLGHRMSKKINSALLKSVGCVTGGRARVRRPQVIWGLDAGLNGCLCRGYAREGLLLCDRDRNADVARAPPVNETNGRLGLKRVRGAKRCGDNESIVAVGGE
jgi:hypothetical protein